MSGFHTYVYGFALSMALTVLAFGLVQWHMLSEHVSLSHELLIPLLIALAIVQLIVQLAFFFNIDQEAKPHFSLIALIFAILIVSIIAGGTIWIMNHLNHNTPMEMVE